jgi:hypothetical protein
VELGNRHIGTWVVYCAIYVVSFAGLSLFTWGNLEERRPDHLVDLLAKISGGAFGIALFAGLSWEVIRFMVLFAPILERKLINRGVELGIEQGLEQGLEQGRKEGVELGKGEERQRWEAWIKRRDEAQANNQPFNEPSPSQED